MKKWWMMVGVGLVLCCFVGVGMALEKGTAAQAEAMVKKAIEYYRANGKEKALAEISNGKGQFIKGDLYVFTWDLSGVVTAHGTNAKLINKDMSQLKDVDGKLFVAEGVRLAKEKGKGWVDYKWTNPTTQKVEQKSTYVEKADDIIFCCGIYK
jgi:signal transduction histidine kinase